MDVPSDLLKIAKELAESIASPDMPSSFEINMVAAALVAEREAQKDLDASIADMHDHRGDIGAAIRSQ